MKARLAPLAILAALAGCIAAGLALQEGPREQGEAALKDRDWARAARLLGDAVAQAKAGQDEILYLLATAQQNGAQHDAAIASLDRLLRDYPASPLKMKALFKKGDVLAAKKEFALAAPIYDAQVAAITAPDRRKRIAMIYVDAGREFLAAKDPKDPTFVADYAAAHRLLSKSLELEALGTDEEGVRADLIACELKGNFPPQQLLKSCDTFEEKFPKSAKMDEVLFARGSALLGSGRPWDAEKAWTRLAAEYAGSKRAPEGLYAAALLHVNAQGNAADTESLRRGLPLLRRVAKDFAASEQGPRAAYLVGLSLSRYEDLRDEARKELLGFVEANAKHEQAPQALLQVAELWRQDQDDAKAIATYEDFLRRFPDSALWPNVRQAIAAVRFDRLSRAKARKDWPQVRTLAQEFVELHATDGRAAQAASEIGGAFKEEKKFKEAVEAWMKVAAKYPGTEEGNFARFRAAELMAAELDDFETAIKELSKVGGGPAAELLARLQSPALLVSSERVFKVGEAPAVKLAVRNLETVKFRFWTLDLKDYFEKKASTAGIQNLEVSVIAPDREWELPVKDYRRFKEFKLDVEVPKKDPGAYIVTASSGRFEATTVVLVSDLAMIARAGRKGATVIVQNMKTGERVAAPALSTAADGKHLKAWTKETTASRLSFMAEAPGGIAFKDLDVSGLPAPPERAPGALILTDRRTYGLEDEVKVRVILRDLEENAFVVPKAKKYRLVASSAQKVPFFEVELTPSGAGVASVSFRIPRGLGDGVALAVFEMAKPQEKLVGVHSVRIGAAPQRARHFDFLMDDKPVFAGDPADVTVVLRDSWGRPMPGRQVRVMTTGEVEWKDRVTGPDGTIAVPLRETGRFPRGGMAEVHVQHENVGDTFAVPVLPRALLLSFEASSRLHEPLAAGEARTVAFSAKRADDSPVGRPFLWKVVRTNEAGERSVVSSGGVATGPDGKGSFAITPKEGGAHQVIVFMKDDDGLPARIQETIAVFDDKEEAKLRLLSAADEFEPGRPFEVAVLSRLEKGPAFVTVESEKVEQVVAVTLDKGRNTVRLAPPPGATRDFTVGVMMMHGNAFHSEARDFRLKDFDLKVEPSKKEYRPGETASVVVTARPGSEVILVAADQVLTGVDTAWFLPPRRGRHFATDSSAALAFQGQTVQIDEQVLNAIARLEDLDKSNAARVMMPKEAPLMFGGIIGGGAGGGGRYGSRLGGKQSLVARGGGMAQDAKRGPGMVFAEPAPLFFGSAVADAAGKATFTFALPQGWGEYSMMAWAVDGSNAIPSKSAEFKARAPVTVEARAPESAVEGEKTSVVALLTNHSGQEQEVTLSFGGDVKVKVPARSTLERTFEWTAGASATFAMDGIAQPLKTELRSRAPSTVAEAGGAFTARTELSPDGQGKVAVRYAVGPAALLEGLGEGRDPLTPASDAAARLVAAIARHRYAKTDATKLAVMEYQARRAAGLQDAAHGDLAWVVLLYLAEAEAKAAEFDVKPDSALLKQRFAQATSDDVKALMLFALARGGEAEYGFVYRLWRAAESLPPRALASVALALLGTKKADEAKAVLARLVKAAKDDHWEAVDAGTPDGSNTSYATTALAAFAIAEIEPANALLAKARAWLLARAPSTPFERAMLALAMQSTNEKSAVTELRIDGQPVKGYGEIVVAKAAIEPTGGGTYYALARRETGKAPESTVKVAVKRTARWPALGIEGVTARGGPVAVKEPVENPSMAKVAAGESFAIDYELTVSGPTTKFAVLELPRVTGLRARAESLRVLISPVAGAEQKMTVSVGAYADAPGVYPDLDVLAAGAEYRAGWQMTHGERLAAGRIRHGKKQWKPARDTLAPLFEKGTLLDAAMIEAARMLAYSAIELKEHDTVVRYFEILKEKSPGEVVPFDKIRAVGLAYASVGEHERAMQVHSGTCDAYFLQEANVVGALDGLGRTRQSTEEMKCLLSDHPDSALNREMLYGLAVRLYWAAKDAPLAPDKEKRKLTRAETLSECTAALERTLAWFPADKDSDLAALTLGSAYLEAGNHGMAERSARAAAARYPKSKHVDGYDYTVAFAQFGQRKFAEALVMCDRLETFDYGAHANPGPAVMRDRAVLMKAQIFHAKGELEKALENYKKLKASSPDAARSAAFLEREAIAVPDVTVVPLAKPAEIELEHAGVAAAQVRAYKVDLTMLALRRKGLSDAASIEVAGIKPVFERAFKLDAPNAKRREKQKLALELKDPGAYVVGVKAGDFFASGLVLRSDLAMTVQEEAGGTVRVNVTNVAAGAFAEGVKVTIFGTAESRIASDKTDLRGIWEANDVRGAAVVVAEKEGHVAMYRGQAILAAQPQMRRPSELSSDPSQQKDALQEQLKGLNEQFEKNYMDNNLRRQEGVEVERTKK